MENDNLNEYLDDNQDLCKDNIKDTNYPLQNSIKEYLKEIAKYPVLSPLEEANYFKKLNIYKKSKLLKKESINNYEINTLDIELLFSTLLYSKNTNYILDTLISYFNTNNKNNNLDELRRFKYLYNKNLLLDDNDLFKYFKIKIKKNKLSEKELLKSTESFINYEYTFDKLVNSNLKLVVSIVKRMKGRLDLLDLINEGNIALMHSIDKFDYKLGYKFSTYASWWIRQASRRALIEDYSLIKVPEQQYNEYIKLKNKIDIIKKNDDINISKKEIAKRLNIEISTLNYYLTIFSDLVSLDSTIDNENCYSIIDTVKDNINVEDEVFDLTLKDDIKCLFDVLDNREIQVIKMRFGLGNQYDHNFSLKEVSKAINMSREGIRQIEYKALLKMRNYTKQNDKAKDLKNYLKK